MLTYFITKNETRSLLNITIWNKMPRSKINFKSFNLKLRLILYLLIKSENRQAIGRIKELV